MMNYIELGLCWIVVVNDKLTNDNVMSAHDEVMNTAINYDDIDFPLATFTDSRHGDNDLLYSHYKRGKYLLAKLNASQSDLIMMSLLIEKLDRLID